MKCKKYAYEENPKRAVVRSDAYQYKFCEKLCDNPFIMLDTEPPIVDIQISQNLKELQLDLAARVMRIAKKILPSDEFDMFKRYYILSEQQSSIGASHEKRQSEISRLLRVVIVPKIKEVCKTDRIVKRILKKMANIQEY